MAKLTKHFDIDKYRYFGYGIGFDKKGSFSFSGGGFAQNVIIFGLDISFSVHVEEGPTQGLSEHSLTAEKLYSVNFTVTRQKFSLGLHYNGGNSYFFVNGIEIIKFKEEDSEIMSPLCLGNISKHCSVEKD